MKKPTKILVVDDDANLRKTLSDILKIKGYETAAAANGAEAVAAAEHETFSLALIDLKLPDMPGLEVMARIKAISPLTEAIILTGHASLDTAIEATKQGAFSYLLKPYQMDDLLLKIERGVERQQAQEEITCLASFPGLLPNAVIEVNSSGEVTYANPVAERLFPDLRSPGSNLPDPSTPDMGMKAWTHPLMIGSPGFEELRQNKQQADVIREVEIGDAIYELHTHYIQGLDLIRVYALDITKRKMAEKEIHLLATTDTLTGIANRREFTRVLTSEVARAKRYGSPLSLVMYDLDFFKRVNDTFGHDTGDYVLQAVTALVKENIRTVDVVARWGGEEFMLLLPQTDMQGAAIAANKLRLIIEGHLFDKVNRLTASFGVTAFEPLDDMDTLLKRVDDALYLAKKKGRNRVEAMAVEAASK